jgi:hypothetical protein
MSPGRIKSKDRQAEKLHRKRLQAVQGALQGAKEPPKAIPHSTIGRETPVSGLV